MVLFLLMTIIFVFVYVVSCLPENRLLLMMAKALKKLESIEAIALQNRASIEALSERMSAAAGKAAKVSPLQTLSELRELDTCLKSRAHYNEMVRLSNANNGMTQFYL